MTSEPPATAAPTPAPPAGRRRSPVGHAVIIAALLLLPIGAVAALRAADLCPWRTQTTRLAALDLVESGGVTVVPLNLRIVKDGYSLAVVAIVAPEAHTGKQLLPASITGDWLEQKARDMHLRHPMEAEVFALRNLDRISVVAIKVPPIPKGQPTAGQVLYMNDMLALTLDGSPSARLVGEWRVFVYSDDRNRRSYPTLSGHRIGELSAKGTTPGGGSWKEDVAGSAHYTYTLKGPSTAGMDTLAFGLLIDSEGNLTRT